MRIAVCVKAVPDAATGARIDPATMRLDRSGDLALSEFDTHAIEEALRLREPPGEGEVGVLSMGPAKAMDALRKALAMGADRAVLVSDDALAGADLVATSKALAAALARVGARPRPLRPAVGRRQRRVPLGGGRRAAAAAGALAGRRADGRRRRGRPARRQTEAGYETLRAPLPAVVAVSDAINEPRYPSLKGIMGAKSKPQETLVGGRRRRRRRERDDGARARAAAAARREPAHRGRRRRRAAAIVDFLAERRLL